MPQITFKQKVFDALPGTIAQIVKKTGVCRSTVYEWVTRLRTEGQCFIRSWKRTAGRYCPRFAEGSGVDAPLPEPLTGAEHSRKHYAKHRRGLEIELRAARKLARENAARMASAVNPWFGALPGARASLNAEG